MGCKSFFVLEKPLESFLEIGQFLQLFVVENETGVEGNETDHRANFHGVVDSRRDDEDDRSRSRPPRSSNRDRRPIDSSRRRS